MQDHYSVTRQGQEIRRISGVDHYSMQLIPRSLIFFDQNGNEITRVGAEIGDVVQPVVMGFYDHFPPIDQSEAKLAELRQRYQEATSIDPT